MNRLAVRLRTGAWVGLTAGLLLLVALGGILVCLSALGRLTDARRELADRLDPASRLAADLSANLVNQETGVRGFQLSADAAYLEPYVRGRRGEATTLERLRLLARRTPGPRLEEELATIASTAATWREQYAEPAIAVVRTRGARATGGPTLADGKALFDDLRAGDRALQRTLLDERLAARSRLDDAAGDTRRSVLAVGLTLILSALVTYLVLRRVVGVPISRVTTDVRQVAGGDFAHVIEPRGPRDVAGLATDVDAMRLRILTQLRTVEEAQEAMAAQATELERSNAELEQFAYVASHDLQEPLRKVASFCQMLERRYGGQLDERGQLYIDYAVDGAKRMQVLINDLLAFSRVGRLEQERVPLALGDLAAAAVRNLGGAIEDAGARVEIDGRVAQTQVLGESGLLTLVFQNLIGNAVKFHGDEAPVVFVSAGPDAEEPGFVRVRIEDNGIGIEPEYADRIFVIFQRLHPKESYAGTGIGLAMCRKIVEHHGGTIRLEPPAAGRGAAFTFTLPVPEPVPQTTSEIETS